MAELAVETSWGTNNDPGRRPVSKSVKLFKSPGEVHDDVEGNIVICKVKVLFLISQK